MCAIRHMQERNAETVVNGRASQGDLLHLVENRSAKAPDVYTVRLKGSDRQNSTTETYAVATTTTTTMTVATATPQSPPSATSQKNWNSIQAGQWE